MRFGSQAKKIENKVQANVITAANENETVRLLIEDYEKKIKQLERERLDDKEKVKALTAELNGNMRLSGEKNEKFRGRSKIELDFLPKIGLIFLPKSSQEKNLKISEFCRQNLRKDWQGLIFDCEGKIALEAYKKRRELDALHEQNRCQHEKNFKEIRSLHLELEDRFLLMEQKKLDYKSKAKAIFLKLNLAQKELVLVKNRLRLIENFHGFDKLKNQEILALEELYSKGLVQCQNERLNRINKKQSHFANVEEEESPRKENRPLSNDYIEFSEDEGIIKSQDSFEEIEVKIRKQETLRKNKILIESKRLDEKFQRNIIKINDRINLKVEEMKKFELTYLDLIFKKTNEERLNFITNSLRKGTKEKPSEHLQFKSKLSIKKEKTEISSDSSCKNPEKSENQEKKINNLTKVTKIAGEESKLTKQKESSSKLIENSLQETSQKPFPSRENALKEGLKIPQDRRKQRFRSLDEREVEEMKSNDPKTIPSKKPRTSKDLVGLNKKSFGQKLASKPLFETQKKTETSQANSYTGTVISHHSNNNTNQGINFLDSKAQKTEKGHLFLETYEKNDKIEVKSAQIPPRTPVFESGALKKTGDQETLTTEDEKKKLLNNPKNTLMTLLSNLNNGIPTQKKPEATKEAGTFIKGQISESCAFKISNYKSILDKETIRLIEEKKKRIMDKGAEPNESGIEKILETDSFFSNCLNGFEYLLEGNPSLAQIGGISERNQQGMDDIIFDSDSTVSNKQKPINQPHPETKPNTLKKKKEVSKKI